MGGWVSGGGGGGLNGDTWPLTPPLSVFPPLRCALWLRPALAYKMSLVRAGVRKEHI